MHTFRFLTLALFLITASSVEAREYHVNASTGSDTNDGSLSQPYKTISRAAYFALPGDVITVHAGTYREWIDPPRGGLSDTERITYRAAPGERVEIKGSELWSDWQPTTEGLWRAAIPMSFFKGHCPFREEVWGDWFNGWGRIHHTADVYLNGKSLYEVESLDRVRTSQPRDGALDPDGERYTWYCETDDDSCVIWANFQDVDPRKEMVEISARRTCFYPSQPGIDYLTISGFDFSQAATQWGAPTAEQIGMISTHWNKGWIIEDNTIHDTKCSGITLGKERGTGHNVWTLDPSLDGSIHYIEVTFRTLRNGWSKSRIGSHVVRRNTIYNCEQTGMCGSQGAAFSQVYDNHIYNIWVKRQFDGAEIAGIKFHAAIDTEIARNCIHHTCRAIWLDWMTQGTRVTRNLMYESYAEDMFIEVNHGPYLVDNNIMLSPVTLNLQSEGGAFVHNLMAGVIGIRNEFGRYTPYHEAHSTEIRGLSVIASGDDRFINNLFIGPADPTADTRPFGTVAYDQALQPVQMQGNVYYRHAKPTVHDTLSTVNTAYDPALTLDERKGELYLEFNIADAETFRGRPIVTTAMLGEARLTDLPFEQADGTPYTLDEDYLGTHRSETTVAGPFATLHDGKQRFRLR